MIGQILSPAETTRYRSLAATANVLAIDGGDIVHCAKELTRHMATPTTADWEKVVRLWRYLGCGTSRVLRHRLGRLQKNTPQYNRRIHSCRISSHQNVVQNTSCCGSQFSGSRIVRLSESVRRNNETHVSMYKSFSIHMNVIMGDASAVLAIVATLHL